MFGKYLRSGGKLSKHPVAPRNLSISGRGGEKPIEKLCIHSDFESEIRTTLRAWVAFSFMCCCCCVLFLFFFLLFLWMCCALQLPLPPPPPFHWHIRNSSRLKRCRQRSKGWMLGPNERRAAHEHRCVSTSTMATRSVRSYEIWIWAILLYAWRINKIIL